MAFQFLATNLKLPQLNERSLAKEKTKHVGHYVINYHHHYRHNEPDEALKQILYNQIGLRHH